MAVRGRVRAFEERHGKAWVLVLVILCASFALESWQNIDFAVDNRWTLVNATARVGNVLFSDKFLVPAFIVVTIWVLILYTRPIPAPEQSSPGNLRRTRAWLSPLLLVQLTN